MRAVGRRRPRPGSHVMTTKRRLFSALTRVDLLNLGRAFELQVSPRMSLGELLDTVSQSKRATVDQMLPELPDQALERICRAFGLPVEGDRQAMLDRLQPSSSEAEDAVPHAAVQAVAAPVEASAVQAFVAPAVPAAPVAGAGELRLSLDVEPRKPRLAWQGMDRREQVVSVPTQVVEIVRPGRAVDRKDLLLNTEARAAVARTEEALPPNRLIWTNDNIVALQTLLDERDATTRDYRYRAKVDLVYIDRRSW